MMASVDSVWCPTPGAFRRDYLERERPAILAGAIDAWPARRWSLDALEARFGEHLVTPVKLREGHFHIDLDEGVCTEPMLLRDDLARIRAPGAPAWYLRLPLDGPFAALRSEIAEPPYCRGRIAMKTNLWVGARGTASDIHYDMTHNFVAQIEGRRRVTLFAPDDAPNLYPYPRRTLNWHHARVRLEQADLHAYPRFADARPIELELAAGEMLWVPRGWWHRFEALEPSIAVNFFWATPRHVPALAAARVLWTLGQVRT